MWNLFANNLTLQFDALISQLENGWPSKPSNAGSSPAEGTKLINRIMKILEVFDRPVDFRWLDQSDETWRGQFDVDGYTYQLLFHRAPGRKGRPGNWYIELLDLGAPPADLFAGRDVSTEPTGRGHPFKVLATATRMVDEFLDTVEPYSVEIQTSDDPSNKTIQGVVDKLSRRYADRGYSIRQGRWDFGDPTKRTTYTRIREPKFRPRLPKRF